MKLLTSNFQGNRAARRARAAKARKAYVTVKRAVARVRAANKVARRARATNRVVAARRAAVRRNKSRAFARREKWQMPQAVVEAQASRALAQGRLAVLKEQDNTYRGGKCWTYNPLPGAVYPWGPSKRVRKPAPVKAVPISRAGLPAPVKAVSIPRAGLPAPILRAIPQGLFRGAYGAQASTDRKFLPSGKQRPSAQLPPSRERVLARVSGPIKSSKVAAEAATDNRRLQRQFIHVTFTCGSTVAYKATAIEIAELQASALTSTLSK